MSKLRYSPKQYTKTRLMGNVRFDPDDSENLYYLLRPDNPKGHGFSIYAHKLNSTDDPTKLIEETEWIPRSFLLTSDGKNIVYQADQQGSELQQIFIMSSEGGESKLLSKNQKKRYFATGNGLLKDNKTLFLTTDQDGTTMDVHSMNIETGEMSQITAADTNFSGISVSPDERYLLVTETLRNTKNELYIYDIENKELIQLTKSDEDINFGFQGWAADSKGFYLTTNSGRDFDAGAYFTIKDKKMDFIIEPDFNVNQIRASRNGKWLAWTVNEYGYRRLHLKDLENNKMIDSNVFPDGITVIQAFSTDSKYMAYNFSNAGKVSDSHLFNLETLEETVLTNNMRGGINQDDMIHPEIVHLESTEEDKLKFSAFLYKPKNAVSEKVPIILSIHGGPESQETPSYMYNGLYQQWLSMGVAVLAPNIRGSTNFGKKFQMLIHRNWGKITGDIDACAKFMQGLDWVDGDKMGVYGGSFGGYATLWAVTQLPDYWKLGIDIVGVSNVITFVKSVPDHWKPIMKSWIGDPVEDEEYLKKASPINYVENIKADMLIMQGANDPRVVKAESDQMVEKLNENGVYNEYVVYEDEGHGWIKEENRRDSRKRILNFISKRFFGEELNFED